jgi:hypothetical protein
LPFPAASTTPLSGPTLGEVAAGAAGDGHRDGMPPGWPSRILRPKPGGRVAGGGGGKRNGPPVPSPPRCGAIPPALPPGRADGDDGDDGARAVACGNAGDSGPLGNNNAATAATVAGKADDARQENDNHGGNNGDNNKDNDKWGRGA